MTDIKYLEVKRAYYNDPENVVVQMFLYFKQEWTDVEGEPFWISDIEYRIKPKTIIVNGIEVPSPVSKEPIKDKACFLPSLMDYNLYVSIRWTGTDEDYLQLSRGLIHLTKDAAIQHAKALLAFTTKEIKK